MAKQFKTMDGNTAAAYVSYAFTEVAAKREVDRLKNIELAKMKADSKSNDEDGGKGHDEEV